MPTGWDHETQTTPQKTLEPLVTDNKFNGSHKEISEISRMEMFIPETPKKNVNNLIVSKTIKTKIKTALNRISYHDVLYDQWNLKSVDPYGNRTAINLFGPPGTGKTFCAEAIAHYLNKKILKVNYAEIESKYVGETPKNVTAAFNKAKETDSVLFFDEADSILGKRLTNVTQSADHGVNVSRSVMLLQLDQFDGVVIFATNLAKNYDEAFVRRILAHIEFELPDQDCRFKLWQYLLPKEVPTVENKDINFYTWLAEISEGLSGGDILNVVIAAASRAVQRSNDQQKVHREDFTEEIKWVRVAKEKIGSSHSQSVQVKETMMKPEELSPEIHDRYDQVVSQIES